MAPNGWHTATEEESSFGETQQRFSQLYRLKANWPVATTSQLRCSARSQLGQLLGWKREATSRMRGVCQTSALRTSPDTVNRVRPAAVSHTTRDFPNDRSSFSSSPLDPSAWSSGFPESAPSFAQCARLRSLRFRASSARLTDQRVEGRKSFESSRSRAQGRQRTSLGEWR
jgi:septal ring-binding cell division protein DamX